MTPTLLLIAAYFVLLAALSAAAMPYRRRMRALGGELCEMDLQPREKAVVEAMLRHAYSWRMAPVLFFGFTAGLFQPGDVLDRDASRSLSECPTITGNPKFHAFSDAFFASVVGVNPVFGLFAIIAKAAFGMKARIHHNSKAAQYMSDLRVAESV